MGMDWVVLGRMNKGVRDGIVKSKGGIAQKLLNGTETQKIIFC